MKRQFAEGRNKKKREARSLALRAVRVVFLCLALLVVFGGNLASPKKSLIVESWAAEPNKYKAKYKAKHEAKHEAFARCGGAYRGAKRQTPRRHRA